MQFRIRYFDQGRLGVVEESVDARSEAELRAQWSAFGAGRVLLELREVKRNAPRLTRPAFQVTWWCRELRTLLRAGMTVVEAIETLHAQSRGSSREGVHEALQRALREGQALSKAMRGVGVFPDVLVASVTASERTSTLVAALDDFLRYDEMLQRLRKQAVSAVIYPAIVISLGVLITLFLLLYVIPRFSRMYVDFRGAVSVPTQLLLWVSRWLHDYSVHLVAVLAGVAVLVVWAWRRGHLQEVAGRLADGFAPLQREIDHFRLAKLYQSLALMFKGGYTLGEALAVCEGLGLGMRLKKGIVESRIDLERGRAVSASFARAGLAEQISERLLASGERTGGFEAVLQTIADRHAEAFATFVERATRIVEPLLLLMVALVVGGIVVMMYMPIFDIASGIR